MSETAFTCLGCGCACDDVTAETSAGGVRPGANLCDLGREWLGDASLPEQAIARGIATDVAHAVDAAAALLAAARGRALVWLGPGLSIQALRGALQLADHCKAAVDTATSSTAAQAILAGQRRGRAAATLGELRNRADVVVFWNTSPDTRYPRFTERFVNAGNVTRAVVQVHVGAKGTPGAVQLAAGDELAALALLRAIALGLAPTVPEGWQAIAALGSTLMRAKYAVIVADGEDDGDDARAGMRAEALIALAQALNTPTRAALVTLRAGGNRTGVESLLTWQTGFPFSVDFSPGHPTFTPDRRGLRELVGGRFSAALSSGDWRALPDSARRSLAPRGVVVIGPRASESPLGAEIMIDTGIAGLHEGGTAYRMDDVPLPLTPLVSGMRSAAITLDALADAVALRFRS